MFKSDLPENDCFEFLTTLYYYGSLPAFIGESEQSQPGLIYGVSIRNMSDKPVRVLGRKWVVSSGGEVDIIEGDSFFGSKPLLLPEEVFAFNGYHITKTSAHVTLTLIGRDDEGHIFRTPVYRLGKP